MIRTKTKSNYLKIIEVYEYYIDREQTDMKDIERLMSNWDAINLFGTYSSLRRGVNKIKRKMPVGKKNFETQKKLFEIYKQSKK
jgi:uncharacterized protein (DUF4213/DUF364 family)